MKVLMLGWELPPHNSGGLGVACYQLCKALSSKGVDIEFVLPYTAQHDIDFMRINAAHPQDVEQVLKAGIAYDSFKYVKRNGDIQNVDLFGQSAIYDFVASADVSFSFFSSVFRIWSKLYLFIFHFGQLDTQLHDRRQISGQSELDTKPSPFRNHYAVR